MLSSITASTLKQYSSSLKLWWEFCKINNFQVFNASVSQIMLFLQHRFTLGASYGSLNTSRSAISLISSEAHGQDKRITRFFRGVFKVRPQCPRYINTWDPAPVLTYLQKLAPIESLTLKDLTMKLVGLLALSTAHRVQTFSLINIKQIHHLENGIEIHIVDSIKTSGPGRKQPCLFLPYFANNVNLCVASTLDHYLDKTKNFRSEAEDYLLLSFRSPYRNVTSQTISKWIKSVLSKSGIDINSFSAHSTRHASTSAASRAGLDIERIRDTAGWTSSSNTFANFYHRPLQRKDDFAKSVLLNTQD